MPCGVLDWILELKKETLKMNTGKVQIRSVGYLIKPRQCQFFNIIQHCLNIYFPSFDYCAMIM